MSGYVDSVISELGMVENMGLAAGTASPALSVQESFPLPGYIVRHFEFRWSHVSRLVLGCCREISGWSAEMKTVLNYTSRRTYIAKSNV